jgi:hypothetical protein
LIFKKDFFEKEKRGLNIDNPAVWNSEKGTVFIDAYTQSFGSVLAPAVSCLRTHLGTLAVGLGRNCKRYLERTYHIHNVTILPFRAIT